MRLYPNFVHEIDLRNEIKKIVGKGGVFIDVGANVGVYTIDLAPLFNKVYAVEPWFYEDLEKNIKDYKVTNVEILPVAAWDFNGVVTIGFNNNSVPVPQVGFEGKIVKSVKLDDVIKENFRLLKVDVEGEAIHVLRGMERLLTNSKGFAIIEVHNHGESHGTFVYMTSLGWKLIRTMEEYRYKDLYHAHKLYQK